MRSRLTKFFKQYGVLPYFLAWFAYFGYFWSHALSYDATGNLSANHVNIWGDWAAHFTMGSSMAYRSLLLLQSPLILGARFSYPFINDMISAALIRLGVPFVSAFTIPSFLASCVLVIALFYFFKTVFLSRKIAIIASLIFLLNGGIGFVYFAADIAHSPNPVATFVNPPHEYTRIDEAGIKWLSVIDSMIIPQRAFTLGFPLTLIAITLVFQAKYRPHKKSIRNYQKLVIAGLILGIMPLIHTHSFLAAGVILIFWMAADLWLRRKNWLQALSGWVVLGIISLAVAIPLFEYYFAKQVSGFIKWYPGWLAPEYKLNWLLFWFRNWTFTPLLAIIGYLVWLRKKTHFVTEKLPLALLFVPFFGLFIVANLWLFQPFAWDNTKLLAWAALGFSGLVGYLFVTQFNSWWSRIIIFLLFVVTVASGTIDAYRILRIDLHEYQMYSAEELTLVQWVKTQTPTSATWLTGTQHNHWLFNLTGRQAVMTYPGWLWTHGYNYSDTENDVREQYQNPQDPRIISKYGVKYVVIGPEESREYKADKNDWKKYYPVIKTSPNYTIFKVSS